MVLRLPDRKLARLRPLSCSGLSSLGLTGWRPAPVLQLVVREADWDSVWDAGFFFFFSGCFDMTI